MSTVSELWVRINADNKGLLTGLTASSAAVSKFATQAKIGFTAAAVVATAASVKMATEFQTSMQKIVALVGVSQKQVDAWGQEILDLSTQIPQTPKAFADAMFFVTSAGFRGAEAMDILKTSAMASASGLGEMKTIADVVTSAMNAYADSGLTAADATDIMISAVTQGKFAPEDLAQSLGQVLPVAELVGVSLDQVAAAIASVSRQGLSVTRATTGFRFLFGSFIRPSTQAVTALESIGMSVQDLQDSLAQRGLLPTLEMLTKKFDISTAAGKRMFATVLGGSRGAYVALALVGDKLEANRTIFENTAHASGETMRAFSVAAQTVEFRFRLLVSTVKSLAIQFGAIALPYVSTALQAIGLVLIPVVAGMRGLAAVLKPIQPLLMAAFQAFLLFKAVAFLPTLLGAINTALVWFVGLQVAPIVLRLTNAFHFLAASIAAGVLPLNGAGAAMGRWVQTMPTWPVMAAAIALFYSLNEGLKANREAATDSAAALALVQKQLKTMAPELGATLDSMYAQFARARLNFTRLGDYPEIIGEGFLRLFGQKTAAQQWADAIGKAEAAVALHADELRASVVEALGVVEGFRTIPAFTGPLSAAEQRVLGVELERTTHRFGALTSAIITQSGVADTVKVRLAGLIGSYIRLTGSVQGLHLGTITAAVQAGDFARAQELVAQAAERVGISLRRLGDSASQSTRDLTALRRGLADLGDAADLPAGNLAALQRLMIGVGVGLQEFSAVSGIASDGIISDFLKVAISAKSSLAQIREAAAVAVGRMDALWQQWHAQIVESFGGAGSALEQFADQSHVNLADASAALATYTGDIRRFGRDVASIQSDLGHRADEFINWAQQQGLAQAGLISSVAAASKGAKREFVSNWAAAQSATETLATQIQNALDPTFDRVILALKNIARALRGLPPLKVTDHASKTLGDVEDKLIEIGAKNKWEVLLGADTSPADTGISTVHRHLIDLAKNKWEVILGADTSQARTAVDAFRTYMESKLQAEVFINAHVTDYGGVPQKVEHAGGSIYHAGHLVERFHNGRLASDEVSAVLQRGEFVIRKQSVAKIGLPALAALNRLHTGGPVPQGASVRVPGMASTRVGSEGDLKVDLHIGHRRFGRDQDWAYSSRGRRS